MSHRSEQKEQRRLERLAEEQAAAKAASRKRGLRIGASAIGAVGLIAVIAVVATAGGGEDGPSAPELTAAAKAAGCTFREFPSEGSEHTTDKVAYKTNPATSGRHNPVPAPDGIYAAGNEPEIANWVHSLEHGRILFQYEKGAPAAEVTKLRAVVEEEANDNPAGYHSLLFQNNTSMPEAYAAVAWTKSVVCPALTPQALDVMRDFRTAYTDKGPELVP